MRGRTSSKKNGTKLERGVLEYYSKGVEEDYLVTDRLQTMNGRERGGSNIPNLYMRKTNYFFFSSWQSRIRPISIFPASFSSLDSLLKC